MKLDGRFTLSLDALDHVHGGQGKCAGATGGVDKASKTTSLDTWSDPSFAMDDGGWGKDIATAGASGCGKDVAWKGLDDGSDKGGWADEGGWADKGGWDDACGK